MGCNLTIEGLNKVIEELYKKGYAIEQARSKALNAGAEVVLDEIINHVPIKKGTLIKTIKKGKLNKNGIGVGSYGYPIAWYVEYGHGGPHPAPPHPYIEPAWEASKGEANGVIAETLKKQVGL